MKYTKEILENAVMNSLSINDVLTFLELKHAGGTHSHISKKIKLFNIDITHFLGKSKLGRIANKHSVTSFTEEVLKKDGKAWKSSHIKPMLFKFNLKDNICEECCLEPFWNGKEIKLQLDHIDGDTLNNELENLRILCPNCHSQTKTYCRRKSVGQ